MFDQRAASYSLALTLSTCLALAISACHDDSLIEDLRETKDKVCQCTDKACVAALQASSRELEKRLQKLSKSEQEKAQAIALKMMACVQKI